MLGAGHESHDGISLVLGNRLGKGIGDLRLVVGNGDIMIFFAEKSCAVDADSLAVLDVKKGAALVIFIQHIKSELDVVGILGERTVLGTLAALIGLAYAHRTCESGGSGLDAEIGIIVVPVAAEDGFVGLYALGIGPYHAEHIKLGKCGSE